MGELEKLLEDFANARKNGFIEVKEIKESGKPVIGVYCGFAPWEILAASGALVAWLCGMSEEPIVDAERDLPRNICPLIKSSYGFAITGKCPYFFFSDMLIGETTCDGKKKMYEYLDKIKPMHIMALPQNLHRKESFEYYKDELCILKDSVEKTLGLEISEESIKEKIKIKNTERKVLREFYELGKLCPPPLTGINMRKVLDATKYIGDKEKEIENIKKITRMVREKYEKEGSEVSIEAKRILVTGCPLGDATEKILEVIEENGGVIVCYESCSSTKSIDDLVDENRNPYDALAERYLKTACACMSPNTNRINMIDHYIDEYKIDGVIDVILQTCHTYNVETNRVKKKAKEKEVPYLSLETTYSQEDIGGLTTRIAAFIEMI